MSLQLQNLPDGSHWRFHIVAGNWVIGTSGPVGQKSQYHVDIHYFRRNFSITAYPIFKIMPASERGSQSDVEWRRVSHIPTNWWAFLFSFPQHDFGRALVFGDGIVTLVGRGARYNHSHRILGRRCYCMDGL